MTNVIERLGKYAGLDFDKQRTPSNPCITVREAIEVANHIATLTAKLAEVQRDAERLRRGEFICQQCGIRKDAEQDAQPDF